MFIDTVRFARPLARPRTGIFTACAATVALVACPAYAQTTVIPAANRITASDGNTGDLFGRSLSLSGNALLVGANFNAVNGNSGQGAAYLFNATTGAQQLKLTAADGAAGDAFGTATALSGNTALVGAFTKTQNGNIRQGAAYLYDATTGAQRLKLTASDGAAEDYFGISTAVSSNTALVGAQNKNVGANRFQGAAYLFNATTGAQQFKLTANDGTEGQNFGGSVALSGSTALIGANSTTVNGNNFQGAAYLFSALTGAQQLKLTASDGAAGDLFGSSLVLSGNTALIGAYGKTVNGNSNQGVAYLFNATTGAQIAQFVASDGAANDYFGTSVALSGNTALIGAYRKTVNGNASQGAVYAFDITTGLQIAKFITADGAANDWFGSAVALNGTNAFAAAQFDDVGANTRQGSVYRFAAVPSAVVAAPEPCSIALLLSAGVPVVVRVRRRAKKH